MAKLSKVDWQMEWEQSLEGIINNWITQTVSVTTGQRLRDVIDVCQEARALYSEAEMPLQDFVLTGAKEFWRKKFPSVSFPEHLSEYWEWAEMEMLVNNWQVIVSFGIVDKYSGYLPITDDSTGMKIESQGVRSEYPCARLEITIPIGRLQALDEARK